MKHYEIVNIHKIEENKIVNTCLIANGANNINTFDLIGYNNMAT